MQPCTIQMRWDYIIISEFRFHLQVKKVQNKKSYLKTEALTEDTQTDLHKTADWHTNADQFLKDSLASINVQASTKALNIQHY